jgi:hypothetical protein
VGAGFASQSLDESIQSLQFLNKHGKKPQGILALHQLQDPYLASWFFKIMSSVFLVQTN